MKPLLLLATASYAQKMQPLSRAMSTREIADRLALKHLVDVFSVLADQKDTQAQTLLFTEDATSETIINGQVVSSLRGRKQLGEAFAGFLANFETVYHLNGQQTLTLSGDKAAGVSYCLVTLIGLENGQRMQTTFGVYYHDDYVYQGSQWLIAKRQATFVWQDKRAVAR